MIITINNDDGTTNFDVNNITDDAVKQEATVIVQKVGNLQVIIEALDFASRTHRANLEELLKGRDEAIVEPERARDERKFVQTTLKHPTLMKLGLVVKNLPSNFKSARCKSLATFLKEIECKNKVNSYDINYPALHVVALTLCL